MSLEAGIKLARWITQVNHELSEIDKEFEDVGELIEAMNDTQEHTINIIGTLLESLGTLYVRSQAQDARITALENVVERFLGDNEQSAADIDSEVAEYNEDDEVGHSTGPHVQIHPVDTFGIVEWDDAGEITRWFLQRLFERA